MGRGELAFTPSGRVYPCERLVGDDLEHSSHTIGSLFTGVTLESPTCHQQGGPAHQALN